MKTLRFKELGPDSLEKMFLEPFSKLPVEQMDKELFFNMAQLEILDCKQSAELYNALMKESWVLQAMEKRVEMTFTAKISKRIMIAILLLNNDIIGRCIIYLLYIQYWAKKNNEEIVKWKHFTQRIFPMGFPTSDSIKPLWDAQKTDQGNMIDLFSTHESIHFKK